MTDANVMELLPCPWCGGQPDFINDGGHGLGNILTEIACQNVDCPVSISTGYFDRWEAIKKWNTRAPDPQLAAANQRRVVTMPKRYALKRGKGYDSSDYISKDKDGEYIETDDMLAALAASGIDVKP